VTDLQVLKHRLEPYGLLVLAVLEGGEIENYRGIGGLQQAQQILVVGNAGSSIWPIFNDSPERRDGKADPLDRWSKRVGMTIAAELDACVLFPFEGPPYPPVLDWALKAGAAFPSPVSMFLHGEYGLWHAYRFALALDYPLTGVSPSSIAFSPCLSCEDQPCLGNCPADAFTADGYRVQACVDFLKAEPKSGCRQMGCAARRACPLGVEFRYAPDHTQFHMDAFLKSQHGV